MRCEETPHWSHFTEYEAPTTTLLLVMGEAIANRNCRQFAYPRSDAYVRGSRTQPVCEWVDLGLQGRCVCVYRLRWHEMTGEIG